MKQISIVASAFYGNKGASSMLEASLQLIDTSENRVGLLSMYPKQDQRLASHDVEIFDARPVRLAASIFPLSVLYRFVPQLRPAIKRVEPAVEFIAESDVYLDQGGITFSDGREKFLPYNIATLLPALALDVPIVKCAQAIGPFAGRLNRVVAKALLPKMRTIVARGESTFEMLTKLGLENVVPGVDLAFAISPQATSVEEIEGKYDKICLSDQVKVGLCPSQVAGAQLDAAAGVGSYASQVSNVVSKLLDDDHMVVLIPHSYRGDLTKTHNNDLPLCVEIARQIGDHENFVFVDEELSATELRVVIGMTDMLITSRFHGMISALAAGVPPLVFGWGHKYREVLESFGLEDAGLDVLQLTDNELVQSKIQEVLDSLEGRKSRITDALPETIRQAGQHSAVFEEAAYREAA